MNPINLQEEVGSGSREKTTYPAISFSASPAPLKKLQSPSATSSQKHQALIAQEGKPRSSRGIDWTRIASCANGLDRNLGAKHSAVFVQVLLPSFCPDLTRPSRVLRSCKIRIGLYWVRLTELGKSGSRFPGASVSPTEDSSA